MEMEYLEHKKEIKYLFKISGTVRVCFIMLLSKDDSLYVLVNLQVCVHFHVSGTFK